MKTRKGGAAGYPVMLSFDDGPRPGTTERILDTLASRGPRPDRPLRAAFFTLARNPKGWLARRLLFAPYEIWTDKGSLLRQPDLACRIVQEGHLLGNHGGIHFWARWPWYRSRRRVVDQLLEWERVADTVVPAWREQSARLARAPYLIRTTAWRTATARTGFTDLGGMTTGDADPRADCDGVRRTLLTRLERERRLAEQTGRPVVLIFHDIRELTAECLDRWLDAISAAGYALTDFAPDRL